MRHNKKIKIAVFPIAGMGTRFLPITKTISKEMLNILDRPLLDYAVQEAKAAGIETFIFVTNKENTKPVDYFSKNTKLESFLKKKKKIDLLNEVKKLNIKKKNMKIIFQDKPSGLADAILRTEKYVKKEDFCVILPDDLIIGSNCTQELINVYNKKKSTVIGVMKVDKKDVSSYGIIESSIFKKNMYKIKNMIEKPKVKDAPSNLAIVGRYILLNDIYKFIKKTKIGSGGELQITDAIFLSSKFNDVWGYRFSGKRYDCGNKIGFLKAQIATAFKDKDIKKEIKKFIKSLGG
jgi:UTP--glucose-1-phosphate uridylyltransferase